MKSRLQSTLIAGAFVVATVPAWSAPAAKPAAKATPAAKPATTKIAQPANGIAAEVNGEKVMMADVNRMLDSLKAAEPSLAGSSPQAQKALTELRGTVVDNLIEHRLMVQEAKRMKITPAAAEITKAMDDFKKRFGTDAAFKAALAKEGKSQDDVRRLITEGMQVFEVGKRWTADLAVTDEEAAKFYREHAADFALPEAVRASHILLSVAPGATQADKDKVKAKAQDLLKRAQVKDADFVKLAQEASEDPGSKNEGGALGWFSREDMVKPFADAAFAATAGKIVGPVETQFGYHIIKVEEKKAAGTMPLDKARDLIKPYLLDTKRKEEIEKRSVELKTKAKIKKFV